jgi:outer membrane protein TolC
VADSPEYGRYRKEIEELGQRRAPISDPAVLIAMRSHSLKSISLIGLIAWSLLIGGCIKLGPNFVRPPAAVEEQWIDTGDPKIKSESADYSNWWTVFNDPVLNSLVETAYQQNLPLRIAGIRILEARARLGIAVGSLYPQSQGASGSWTQFKASKEATLGGLPPPSERSFNFWDVGLDAAWELDFWGKFRRGIESSDAELGASVADYDNILVSLVGEVAATYALIRTFQERLEFARENVKIQQRSLQIAEARFRGGAVTELDVAQAKTLLRDTEALIPELERGLRAVDLSLIQYRQGLVDYNRVLDSQRFLVGQQDDLAARRGDVVRNLIAIYKALGGGWEIRQGKDFVPDETRKEMQERTDWGDLLFLEEIEPPPSLMPDF